MELSPDGEPIVILVFKGFDDAVLASRRATEAIRQSRNRHVVPTGHSDFAFAIDATQNGIAFDHQRMAVIRILGIQVWQGRRNIDGYVIVKVAALNDVQQLMPDADSKNFVLCPGGEYDRSPCGTGTSAKMAALHAHGTLALGVPWRQESITGGLFVGRVERRGDALIPFVRGRAFVTAESTLRFDPRDPFRAGF